MLRKPYGLNGMGQQVPLNAVGVKWQINPDDPTSEFFTEHIREQAAIDQRRLASAPVADLVTESDIYPERVVSVGAPYVR